MTDAPHNAAVHERPTVLPSSVEALDLRLATVGLQRTGAPDVVRRWELAVVMRVPTDRGPVWFKTVPALFAHEGRITEWLAQLWPHAVPDVLAAGDGWMLTREMPAPRADPRGHPLALLAQLQVESIGRTDELRALGCPEQQISDVAKVIADLCTRRELMSAQHEAALGSHLGMLHAICERAEALTVPRALVHGDVHVGNCRWTRRGWMLFDWTDACVGHPFIDLAQPLQQVGRLARDGVRTRYAAVWREHLPASDLDEALRSAPVIGAAHHLERHHVMIERLGRTADLVTSLRLWTDRLIDALVSHREPVA